jgi:hypothetical protein
MGKWARALLAVLLGNLIYFGVMPRLPAALRHVPFRFDVGLLLDIILCTVVWILLNLVARRR